MKKRIHPHIAFDVPFKDGERTIIVFQPFTDVARICYVGPMNEAGEFLASHYVHVFDALRPPEFQFCYVHVTNVIAYNAWKLEPQLWFEKKPVLKAGTFTLVNGKIQFHEED